MRSIHVLAPVCTMAVVLLSAPSFSGDLHEFDDQANFKTSGDFVRGCAGPKVSVNCMTDFVMTDIAEGKSGQHCLPDTSAANLEQGNAKRTVIVVSLVAWLKIHPEYSKKRASEGLSAAMHSVYPCH
jgi:hypothetical protein